jgi:hypothetical protein
LILENTSSSDLPTKGLAAIRWSTVMKSTEMNNDNEPPSCLRPPIFMIGQDSRGNWVVQDKAGTRGGLFVGRNEALRYIRLESERHALVTVAGCLELDISVPAVAALSFSAQPERRVA